MSDTRLPSVDNLSANLDWPDWWPTEIDTQFGQGIETDLQAVAEVQKGLLPTELPQVANADFAWRYQPCAELGGDCLNVFRLDQDNVGLYVLDVSGHGLSAAVFSVALSHILSPFEPSILTRRVDGVQPQITPPREVLQQLNERFPFDVRTGEYFTLLYGILDCASGEFTYATAGQPGPAYLPYDAEPDVLDGYGLPIGLSKKPEYRSYSVSLRPKDRLYLFTDGVIEALSPSLKQFGQDRLCRALVQNRETSLADGLSSVLKQVDVWCGGRALEDDVSILAVDMAPEPAGTEPLSEVVPLASQAVQLAQ